MIAQKSNTLSDSIVICIIVLMATGIVFVFSAAANISSDINLSNFYKTTSIRQIMFFPLAVVILLAASAINYRRFSFENGFLRSPTTYALIISIILLALLLSQRIYPFLPSLIPAKNEHFRWLNIPLGPASVSFQPSELAKWATVFFLAAVCTRFHNTLHSFRYRFVPICTVVAFVTGLIVVEDLGTAAFIGLLSFIILAIAGARWKHLLIPVPFALLAIMVVLLVSPYRMNRLLSFFRPGEMSDSTNYQASQSLIAIGSGGAFGKGLGKGICKYGHLPEDTNDFIFAIIGEELGLVGTVGVIFMFMVFCWLGLLVVKRCRDPFGKLLAAGIVLTIALQAAINIGVVTVVLPTKGIPLPFVSAGGSSLLLSAGAVGILLNIAQQTDNQ